MSELSDTFTIYSSLSAINTQDKKKCLDSTRDSTSESTGDWEIWSQFLTMRESCGSNSFSLEKATQIAKVRCSTNILSRWIENKITHERIYVERSDDSFSCRSSIAIPKEIFAIPPHWNDQFYYSSGPKTNMDGDIEESSFLMRSRSIDTISEDEDGNMEEPPSLEKIIESSSLCSEILEKYPEYCDEKLCTIYTPLKTVKGGYKPIVDMYNKLKPSDWNPIFEGRFCEGGFEMALEDDIMKQQLSRGYNDPNNLVRQVRWNNGKLESGYHIGFKPCHTLLLFHVLVEIWGLENVQMI